MDGWLHTGDMGYICPFDTDFLYVVGRFKSLLISSDGEKYSPEGFEDSLTDGSKFINSVVLHNNQDPYTMVLIVPDKGFFILITSEWTVALTSDLSKHRSVSFIMQFSSTRPSQ